MRKGAATDDAECFMIGSLKLFRHAPPCKKTILSAPFPFQLFYRFTRKRNDMLGPTDTTPAITNCSDCRASSHICGHCHKLVCKNHTWKECSRCQKPLCTACHDKVTSAQGTPDGQLQCSECGQPRCDSCSMRCRKCKNLVCWFPPNQQQLSKGCLSDKCASCHRQFCKKCLEGAAAIKAGTVEVQGCPECGKEFKKTG